MKYDELLPWLYSRTTDGIRWGTERTEGLLAGVDNPHRLFRSIHIAGTNGKGSVAALCDAALRAAGVGRVGLYTSPHLIHFAERIRIDGRPATEAQILASVDRLGASIEESGATFFEATTALAFDVFGQAGVDVAVVEVGLGGRLDSTNVVRPEVTGITNIALDHADYLGSDLAGIAREKAGIFKAGVPAVVAETDRGVLRILEDAAREARAPFHRVSERARVVKAAAVQEGTRLQLETAEWEELEVTVPLRGEHQTANIALAAALLGELPADLRPAADAVVRGFAGVRWAGRLQIERVRGTTWVFDVAHNPAGARSLAEAIPGLDLPSPIVGLVGILADKEWRPMLESVAGFSDALVLTVPPTAPPSRRWDPEAAAATLEGHDVRVIPDLTDAVFRATTMAPHGTIVVTGSVHTVGDAMAVLGLSA